jgi:NAD(P)-dependent dehydrogenase (short-subunit alcohol dehydrogenase family)
VTTPTHEAWSRTADHTLTGRTVIVTGAAGYGVGAGVCDAVAAAGGQLVVNDLDPAAVEAAVARYPDAIGIAGDVTDGRFVAHLLEEATRLAGPVTGVVNNAGVGLSQPFHEADDTAYHRLMDVDVRAPWLVTREFVRRLDPSKDEASIVNISSVHAQATMSRYALYAAAKSAIEGLTRGMAVELGPRGIRCNAVAPGYVDAAQNVELLKTLTDDPAGWIDRHTHADQALPRLVEPVDCGNAVAFLLSDAARCITGQILAVDAGLTVMLYRRDR